MLVTVVLSSDYVKLLRSLATVYPETVPTMKDDDRKKDDDKKKDGLCELGSLMKVFVLTVSLILSPACFLSCEARRQCQENVLTMQDDDKRRDDDKKKDSLCKIGRLRKRLGHARHCCALAWLHCEDSRNLAAVYPERFPTMKDDDRKKDDGKKKDSLCELVSLYEGLCPSSQVDSESCLVLLMRSPSTVSRECSHHAGR